VTWRPVGEAYMTVQSHVAEAWQLQAAWWGSGDEW